MPAAIGGVEFDTAIVWLLDHDPRAAVVPGVRIATRVEQALLEARRAGANVVLYDGDWTSLKGLLNNIDPSLMTRNDDDDAARIAFLGLALGAGKLTPWRNALAAAAQVA